MRPTVVAAAVLLLAILSAPFAWGKSAVIVSPGQSFRVHVTGFAPLAAVELRLANTTTAIIDHADRNGVLDTRYRAPRTLGHYRLLVSGAPRGTTSKPRPHWRMDHDFIVTVVPRIAIIPFIVQKSGGGVGGGTHHRHPHHRPPATTGTDLETQLVLATFLLLLGGATLALRRRRA